MKSDSQILKVLAGSDSDNCKTSTSHIRTVPVGSAFSYQQKIVQSASDIVIKNLDEVIFLKTKTTTTNEILKIITNNEREVQNFLASRKSYSQLDGDRMSTFFEATYSAKARSALTSRRIKEGSW